MARGEKAPVAGIAVKFRVAGGFTMLVHGAERRSHYGPPDSFPGE